MAIKTTVNVEYLGDVWHTLKLKNRTTLFREAGLAGGYGSKLLANPESDVRLTTIDKLHNYIERRMDALGLVVPDDLWQRLIIQREVEK